MAMRYELMGTMYRMVDRVWWELRGRYSKYPDANFSNMYQLVRDKDVAVVGNACSILNEPHNIDRHGVVIRINKGYPFGKEKYLGWRTDILASSYSMSENTIRREYGTPLLFWVFDKWYPSPFWKYFAYQYPPGEYKRLMRELGGVKPSSGCSVVNFLTKMTAAKEIHLYGFDFLETPTWWAKDLVTALHNPHSGEAEEQYIRGLTTRLYVH